MYNLATRISEKCIACYPRIEQMLETRCMTACVGKIRLQGLKDSLPEDAEANPENPMNFLIHTKKIALPLYPQYGTEPNIYYIPPRWVPKEFLYQMFGPGVDDALRQYSKPDEELLGVFALFRTTRKIIETFNINSNHAVGYDAKGQEIIRVPIDEPVIVRPPRYHNTT
jgi:nitrate reductase beta subunit